MRNNIRNKLHKAAAMGHDKELHHITIEGAIEGRKLPGKTGKKLVHISVWKKIFFKLNTYAVAEDREKKIEDGVKRCKPT